MIGPKGSEFFINTDGGSRGNPGPAAIGVVIKDSAGNVVELCGKYIGITTNNVAEYEAVVEAYQKLIGLLKEGTGGVSLVFYLDSQLVANQLAGNFKIKNDTLKELAGKIKTVEKNYRKVSYNYIPREKNFEADRMVNKALNERNA